MKTKTDGVVDYANEMQRLCCTENHKAFIKEFADIKTGEIKMYGGLPGFVVVLPNGIANLRTFDTRGRLIISKVTGFDALSVAARAESDSPYALEAGRCVTLHGKPIVTLGKCSEVDPVAADEFARCVVAALTLCHDIASSTKDTIWQPDWHALRARALTIVAGR